jgi:3-hydroxybutyryl-CoA dehydrogenase
MDIKKVGVVGFGTMGAGVVQACAQAGYEVRVVTRSDASLNKGFASIRSVLNRRVERGSIKQSEKDAIEARIKGSTVMEDLSDCDIVIEAVSEDLQLKKAVFARLDDVCSGKAVLASNTSCLSITDMATATKHPDKVLGMHFHNPAPVMKLVEVIKTLMTSQESVAQTKTFGESLGKTVVVAPDISGFIVTRLVTPFLLGAVRMLEDGIASRDEIDASCKLALNHPMGPLELIDFIGLDTELAIDEAMYEETKDLKYAPPVLLRKMVAAGWLGRKTGKGFYEIGG